MLQNNLWGTVLIFFGATFLTSIVRRYVMLNNMLDIPNERSSHQAPTPRGGGLSIVIIFTLTSAYLAFQNLIPLNLFYALCGGMIIAAIGWIDDVTPTHPLWRAIVHTIAALWAIYWLNGFPYLKWEPFSYFVGVLTVVWCVNLYNFMDGIDGLAGAQGLFISLGAAFALKWIGTPELSILCFFLATTIAGFLTWNWPPAKIFMGDIGSGYLGFVFAVLAISTANMGLLPLSFWCVISAVFLCDATFTVLYRAYCNKPWYKAHREHAYQRLIQGGASHQAVTLSILFVNIFILFPTAYAILSYPQWRIEIVSIGFFGIFALWTAIVKMNACKQ
ncbi:MAG: hypothetical protein A3F11_03070 [Gammaproteobacteria bacterium RIFCSPHIGHO2_12_FULL_37_14]|nr:MAG: hypothetical protein A3F11_03070 [Gammaproteobacteria bacterium RIFCSPHIGHO2_12_FULL_37_14]